MNLNLNTQIYKWNLYYKYYFENFLYYFSLNSIMENMAKVIFGSEASNNKESLLLSSGDLKKTNKRFYSTSEHSSLDNKIESKNTPTCEVSPTNLANVDITKDLKGVIDPWFITGFTDGEGCFNLSITKNKNLKSFINI